MTNSKESSRRKLMIAAIVAIIALLGINAFLLYNKYQLDHKIEEQEGELAYADSLRVELNREYEAALEELEFQKGENEELNSMIEEQKEELRQKKIKIERAIRSGRKSANELKEAKFLIDDMVLQREQFVSEIRQLKLENKRLAEGKQIAEAEKKILQKEITEERQVTEKLIVEKGKVEEEKTQVEARVEELEDEKGRLQKKVDVASVLKVSSIAATPLKVKKSGTNKPAKYAKRTDKIEVCFTINENKVTKTGKNEFFLRILNPIGETLAIESKGSGQVELEDGSELRYTTSEIINYKNIEEDVCIYWDRDTGSEFKKGKYIAEIYNKGFMVGKTNFTLK